MYAIRSYYGRLEAMLAVADEENSLIITGNGDVLEPEKGIVAIGSGGAYAQSAARALLENTDLPPEEIVAKSLAIAGDLVITSYSIHYTKLYESGWRSARARRGACRRRRSSSAARGSASSFYRGS